VRPCFVWGNGDTTLTPRAIGFLKSSPVVIHFGRWHGKNRCPLAHVENVCTSLLAAATLDEMGGKAIHVLDPERTTLSGYYRMIRDRFLPEKRLREITMPVWTVRPAAKLSSGISTLLNRYVPVFDPSDYALDTIIHNLDFSSEMMCAMIGRAGGKVIHTNEGTF